jgi:crossover junction endodeoxyribonuclease RuvC
MIVLGIDPGTAVTGFGIVTDEQMGEAPRTTRSAQLSQGPLRLVECGVIRTRAREPLAVRLQDIHAGVQELIARHRPDVLAVEGAFYARNVRTTLALGHARGVVLLAGVEAGLPIREYPPAEIKKAVVGTGAATKEQVQYMIMRLLRLKTAPQPSDAADGVATALTCMLGAHLEPGGRGVPRLPSGPVVASRMGSRRAG